MNLTNLSNLPLEILLQICSYLDRESLNNIGQTSHLFDSLTEDTSLWKKTFKVNTCEDSALPRDSCLKNRITRFNNNKGNYKKIYLSYLRTFCILSKNYMFDYKNTTLEVQPKDNLFKIKNSIETQLIKAKVDACALNQYFFFIDLITHVSLETIQLLLDNDAEFYSYTLFKALEYKASCETIQLLIDNGAEFYSYTLFKALEYKASFETIKLLIDNNAKLNDDILFDALRYKASFETIQLLIAKGAKLNDYTLSYALECKASFETIQLIKQALLRVD